MQVLIREVAYRTLAKRDRKTRHLAAARFLESLGTDELAGAIASQYLAAHASSGEGPEADALAGQARIALSAAAERAARLGAHDQAMTFLEQALSVAGEPSDKAALLQRAADSAVSAAQTARGEAFARQAVALNQEIGNADGVALATANLASMMVFGRRIEESIPLLEGALENEDALGPEARATLLSALSRASMRMEGGDARATELADRALAIAEPLQFDAIVPEALLNKGSALAGLGRPREAIALLSAAITLARDLGATTIELRAMNNLGAAQFLDDPIGAWETGDALLELAERIGNRGQADWLLWGVAADRFFTGHWDEWPKRLEERLAEELEDSDRAGLLIASLYFPIARGDDVDARLATTASLAASISDPYIKMTWDFVRALRALTMGDFDTAIEAGSQMLHTEPVNANWHLAVRAAVWAGRPAEVRRLIEPFAADPNSRFQVPRAGLSTARAGLAALEGRQEDALGLFREAWRMREAHRWEWELACIALDMATVLDPSLPEVRTAADKGREVFERLGARPFLERLDTAMKRDLGSLASPAENQAPGRADQAREPVG